MTSSEEIGAVLAKYPPELLTEMAQAIRASVVSHPPFATCPCPAIDALRVLERWQRG